MTRHIIALCGAMALVGLTASAQSQQPSMSAETVTATGCLKVWDETVGMSRSDLASPQIVKPGARQYILANVQGAHDGTTFVLESQGSASNLRALVNHTVEVKGQIRAADNSTKRDTGGTELDSLATLAVSSVTSVSSSCR